RDPDVGVEPITLDAAFAAELERRTVLCYTGRSRMSGATIARVMAAYGRGDRGVTDALRAMKEVAETMAEAVRSASLTRVAALLTENWKHQQALDPEMRTPEMAQLEQAVTAAGALGGKAAGSGAGGCMFFVTGDSPAAVIAAARAAGATLLPDPARRAARPPLGASAASVAGRARGPPGDARRARWRCPSGGPRRGDPAGLRPELLAIPQPGQCAGAEPAVLLDLPRIDLD